jgi:lysophospholipase L1-like esterase
MNDTLKNMARRNKALSLNAPPRRPKMLLAWSFFLFAFSQNWVYGQRVDFTYKTYGLEVDADNVIHNAAHLEPFFESLYQLQFARDQKVNIVHIGDSHIQADYMTAVIRRNFQFHFGNAGRGLIVPLRVAQTNEPSNFKTSSNVVWKSKRCVFPDQPLPIGIGGVTIETTDPQATLDIYMNDLWQDNSFNTLTLFYQKDARSFDFSVREPGGPELARINAFQSDSTSNSVRVSWERKVNAVTIQSVKANADQTRATIYGAVVENSANGVLYHTIGVNGAKFRHYNEAKYFAEQTADVHPDVFIISLGTNESIEYPYLDKTFPSQIDRLLTSLRMNNPNAAFILVTPQDVFKKKNKPNPGILQVRDMIVQYAVENGLAFYDLYRAMGGENSAKSWTENSLLSRDGIHLTKDGYEYQGNLFFHALMKSYNFYVPNRHP